MDALGSALVWTTAVAAALLLERVSFRLITMVALRARPISGDQADSCVYQRNLWAPKQPDTLATIAALAGSGILAALGMQGSAWMSEAAVLVWLGALGWDLWNWERVGASVKFISWRRGWRKSARRVAISDLRELHVSERRPIDHKPIAWLVPGSCKLVLVLSDGKAVKLPRTGTLFGGSRSVENLAHFVRMQMELVADNRRKAAADKRAAARRAMQPPPPPMHQAAKVDPGALPLGMPR